jgi:hypothetical protein
LAHGRDKPGREKRKPKKEKSSAAKLNRGSDVLDHVAQHTPNSEEQRT